MGFVRKLTGADAARQAAQTSAQIQADSGKEAIALNREQFNISRQDLLRELAESKRDITQSRGELRQYRDRLNPFYQFGLQAVPQAQRLFGSSAGQAIIDDPVFQSLADESERRIMASQAARGRLGTGETPIMLQDAFLRTGADLLGQQRSDILSALGVGLGAGGSMANIVSNIAGLGTNMANLGAGTAQAVAGLGASSAARSGDLLTQIGNAQASGLHGAAAARRQGFQDILGIGGAIGGILCDRRAKRDITPYGSYKGHKTYKFRYKHRDDWFVGPMADEVYAKKPEATFELFGFRHVIMGDL